MSRFVGTKLREIDLGEGEWIKIPVALSYDQVLRLTSLTNDVEISKSMLIECIKEWNIKDEDGNIPPVNIENILKLDIFTIKMVSDEVEKMLKNNQDKKK